MKKITKLVCVAMALVILVCSTNGATASAAKRIYFAGEYRCKFGPGVVLMIGGQYLGVSALVLVEADVVLQDVEQPPLLKHAEEEGAVVGDEGRFIRSVHGLPLHVAGLLGGDGAGTGLAHVADHVEGVVAEEAGHALLIVLDLLVGVVDGGVFGDGALQLYHHEGQPVDHHHHVAALALILLHAPLVHHLEEVSFGTLVVDEPHQGRPLLAVLQVADLQPVLHPEGKLFVVLLQCPDVDASDLTYAVVHGVGWQVGIQPPHRGEQVLAMEGLPVVALHLVAALVSVAELVPEQGNERLLVCVFGEFLVVCHVVNILYFLSRYFLSLLFLLRDFYLA